MRSFVTAGIDATSTESSGHPTALPRRTTGNPVGGDAIGVSDMRRLMRERDKHGPRR